METAITATPAIRNVTDWNQVPGSNNYFRTSDVTPHIDADGSLIIYNSYGNRRSWGTPKVSSSVRTLTADVIAIEVTGWHKWTVSPVGGSFYFVNEAGGWVRRTANAKVVKAALSATAN
jgi:hypothetical protein